MSHKNFTRISKQDRSKVRPRKKQKDWGQFWFFEAQRREANPNILGCRTIVKDGVNVITGRKVNR